MCYCAYCHAYWGCRKADCLGCLNKLKGETLFINLFSVRHDFVVIMFFGCLYCKQYGPRSDYTANNMDPDQTILQKIWIQFRLYCKQYEPRSDYTANNMDPDQTILQPIWTQIRLYCKQYGPRSDCSLGSSLIRVHSVCFHDKIKSEVHLNISSSRKKEPLFSGQKILAG